MKGKSLNLSLINILGGSCVLLSYLHGAAAEEVRGIWGGIAPAWQPLYTASMLAATVGYFPFTYFLLRNIDLDEGSFAGDLGYNAIAAAYLLILLPSSMWLPLTLRMLQAPSSLLWLLIRVDLSLVALGTITLIVAAATYRPVTSEKMRVAALIGLAFFALQTVILDGVIWPALFPA